MMRSMFAALLGVACACMARAQVPGIPDSLLKNSDAVARLMSVDFVYNTPTSASAKFVEETTILNNTATDKGSFTCYVSPTSSLKNFSGTLCDAQGRTLRKFKRSDLKYTEFSGGSLASDIATYYLEVYAPSYPYTVRYEYEMAYKNGLFNFPTFIPVGSKGTALEKGVYTVSVPAGMPVPLQRPPHRRPREGVCRRPRRLSLGAGERTGHKTGTRVAPDPGSRAVGIRRTRGVRI